MPAPPVIRAAVVDIQQDTPRAEDIFLVDTNVWYWFAYPRAGNVRRPPNPYQVATYPTYLNTALTMGAALCRTGITFAELTAAIEEAERQIHNIGRAQDVGKKAFRYERQARRGVIRQVLAAWRSVTAASHHIDIAFDDVTTRGALARVGFQPLDGSDAAVIGSCLRHGISRYITDDADFAAVPGIQVFTANPDVLAQALAQGQLLSR